MKFKVILSMFALLFVTTAIAQDCTFFFPQTEGVQLVKKGYDTKGNLQSVMTYTIDEVDIYPSGMVVEADYVFQDSTGNVYTMPSNTSKSIIEIHYSTSYYEFIVQDVITGEGGEKAYPEKTIIVPINENNWVDFLSVKESEIGELEIKEVAE